MYLVRWTAGNLGTTDGVPEVVNKFETTWHGVY